MLLMTFWTSFWELVGPTRLTPRESARSGTYRAKAFQKSESDRGRSTPTEAGPDAGATGTAAPVAPSPSLLQPARAAVSSTAASTAARRCSALVIISDPFRGRHPMHSQPNTRCAEKSSRELGRPARVI